jgi:metabolite-proton symporter
MAALLTGQLRRVLLASLVGSAIEWFDFFLYGSATAIVFNRLFFPAVDPLVSLLLAYMSFALPFFIRPLGGIIFSHIGDRVGRKRTLVLTLTVMGGGTTLIGFLPSYASIGVAAPCLLVLLRLIQGIGLGGEWGGAVLLAYEYATPGRRGFFSSIPQAGVTIGILFSTLFIGLASMLPEEQFLAWGWRVPFVMSAGLVALGLLIRSGIDETPQFRKLQSEGGVAKFPVAELLRNYRSEVLTAVLVKFAETGPFYIFAVFLVSYATTNLGYSRPTVLTAIAAAALVATFIIPLCGLLADRVGRRPVFLAGSLGLIIFSAPYFWLLSQRSVVCILAASIIALGLIWPFITATLSTLLAEMFPPKVRYSGISLGYQIGGALVGGTAPLVGTLLLAHDNGRWRWIACYIASLSLISGMAVIRSAKLTPYPPVTA